MKFYKLTLVFATLLFASYDSTAGSVVIVNKDNNSKVSISDIKKLYLGKKGAFSNGNRAKLTTLAAGSNIRQSFNTQVLNKSEPQYAAYWAKMAFTGRAEPPVEYNTSEQIKAFVGSTPDAIGIIDETEVDGSVKVVLSF
ncbi:phosphate ABC transporter substrate-binding protein [Psychrosphaera sp.]|nr:phosphate ABC transporter substrate-binding protein [Psychrosphaera sp.]